MHDDKTREEEAAALERRESPSYAFSASRRTPRLEDRQKHYVQGQVSSWQAAVCDAKRKGKLSVTQLLVKRAADLKLDLNDDGWTDHHRRGFF